MSDVKDNRWYSKEHEWVERLESGNIRMGISDFAQHQLGDIVFVELPDPGTTVVSSDNIGTIESVKTVSDLYCPVNGTVVTINDELSTSPELVNSDPYDQGWMIEIEITGDLEEQLSHLLNAADYRDFVKE